ncbi:TPA: choline transporter, partial [Klebsiella pneumoniae]|nr:choline transporter [Klebsiella pneumoniae]
CATETISFFMLWIYLTVGVMLIFLWYMTTWRAYQHKEKEVKSKLTPEDFVK